MRTVSPLLLALVGLLWGGPGVGAQPSLEVSLGFADQVVEQVLNPVRVRVRYRGLPQTARLVLSQTVDSPWNGVFRERVLQALPLGPRSDKLLTVLFPFRSLIYPFRVSLEGADGEVLAEQTVRLRDRGHPRPLSVFLGGDDFSSRWPDGKLPFSISRVQLPERVEGYEALGRLYVGRFDLSSLSGVQQRALLDWLMLGGELVLLGGDNWPLQAAPFLEPWLPLAPDGLSLEPLDGKGPLLMRGTVRGRVRFAVEGRAWLLSHRVGRGTLWLTALNPLSAEVPADFWRALRPSQPEEAQAPFTSLAQDLFGQLVVRFPSRALVAGLLGAFWVGSVLWGWLAVRRGWSTVAWVAWALAFSGGLAFWLTPGASPLIVAEFGISRSLPDGAAWRQSWLGVFSQRREELRVELATGTTSRQLLPVQRGDHLFDLDEVRDGPGALRFTAHAGQERGVLSTAVEPAPLRWDFDPQTQTVTLSSSLPLEGAWLWREGVAYDLGRLSPSVPQRVTLSPQRRVMLEQTLPREAWSLWRWALRDSSSPLVLGAWHAQPWEWNFPLRGANTLIVHLLISEGET